MADMVDCGYHCFMAWQKECAENERPLFYRKDLGAFNPDMSADEANVRCDHVGKLIESAQEQFKRGWEKAKDEFIRSNPTAVFKE